MKIDLEINNVTKSPVENEFLQQVAQKTFAKLDAAYTDKCFAISVAFVTPQEIQKFNKQYREYDSVTDILSFAEYENKEEIQNQLELKDQEMIFLGELILCYDDIKEYCEKEQKDLPHELAKVFAHGILHLLGFDHGEKMFAIQEKVANEIVKNNS